MWLRYSGGIQSMIHPNKRSILSLQSHLHHVLWKLKKTSTRKMLSMINNRALKSTKMKSSKEPLTKQTLTTSKFLEVEKNDHKKFILNVGYKISSSILHQLTPKYLNQSPPQVVAMRFERLLVRGI